MFNDEETIAFKKMYDFSTADGFVEITEDLSDMIKSLAKEPSVGLFYIQQHTHSSTANLLRLDAKVLGKSHETSLHTEDLEDSITMLGSMKECGFPIVDEMVKEIKRSLSMIRKPKRGFVTHSPGSGFLGKVGSWYPASWGQNSLNISLDREGNEASGSEGEGISTDLDPMVIIAPESCLWVEDQAQEKCD